MYFGGYGIIFKCEHINYIRNMEYGNEKFTFIHTCTQTTHETSDGVRSDRRFGGHTLHTTHTRLCMHMRAVYT